MTLFLIILGGLVWGSFLNVVIYRLPRDLSLVRPPSSCPGCGARIRPADNIPILSYILLGGKCRNCGRRISPVYPLVEGLTALGFVLVYTASERVVGLEFLAGCAFTSALIVLGFIDYFHQLLFDVITLPGLVLALAYALFRNDLLFRDPLLLDDFVWLGRLTGGPAPFREALIGAALGGGFLLLVYGVYLLIRRTEGLGMGDVTMMLMVGAALGPWRTLLVLVLGSFLGSVAGLFLILFRGRDFKFAVPFGTFLAPAAFISMLWGERIVRWYFSFYQG